LVGIEGHAVIDLAVDVGMFARKYGSPGRRADGIGNARVGKQHAFIGEAIDIGRLDQLVRIGADGLIGMIIGHDEKNIRFGLSLLLFNGATGKKNESQRACGQQEAGKGIHFHIYC
jgi:hypothetical protein